MREKVFFPSAPGTGGMVLIDVSFYFSF